MLALLIYMPVFGFLDKFPIRIWDEARIANNAVEMLQNGNYIVTHYEGHPDIWNTKPPLLVWMQVALMKTIGINELAVRLPSALAALLTCLALLIFSIRYLKKFWIGFISILVLITTQGYLYPHAARGGDYDALLTLFTTSGCLLFFAFCETKNNRFLYLFFVSLTLGLLTKGVAGLLFTPAFIIYALFQKQVIPMFKNKHFYVGLFIFLFFTIGYYYLRNAMEPGYFKLIMDNELGGRFLYSQGAQPHQDDFWYYLNYLLDNSLSDRFLLIPCGLLLGLFNKDNRIRKITLYLLLTTVTFYVIISLSKTKLYWYNIPLYPLISFLTAIFINWFFELFKNLKFPQLSLTFNLIPYLFLFLIFSTPYLKVLEKTYNPSEYSESDKDFYRIGYFLQDAVRGKYDLNNKYLLHKEYNAHNRFYIKILNEKGVKIDFKDWSKLNDNEVVIVFQKDIMAYLKEHYIFTEKKIKGEIVECKIVSKI